METDGWPKPVAPQTPPALPPMCVKCRRTIDPTYKYCPHCGQRQRTGEAWYYNPIVVLLLAFFVLGPFAIPLVWRSPRMTAPAKTVATAAILAYTAYCCYLAWQIVAAEMRPFAELDGMMRELHPR